jgi:pyrroloquinoline quinone biosynthesis protein B
LQNVVRPYQNPVKMKILVLGAGAGGGFPQWNCNCRLCGGQRSGHVCAAPRTQSSIAVSTDGRQWVLLNASPDLGAQLRAQHQLHPQEGLRHSPIRAVVVLDAQVDHVTGLLSLREGPPIRLYATPSVFEDLTTGLPILPVLEHYCGVQWHLLPVAGDTRRAAFHVDGFDDLLFEAVAIPGLAPPYSAKRHDPTIGDTIALRVRDRRTGQRLFYAPGLADVGPDEFEWLQDADCVIVDGTFWAEASQLATHVDPPAASARSHLPQTRRADGAPGMIDLLAGAPARRKVLIHIHNSNPILDDNSRERRELEAHGIEVAYDGMEIQL